LATPLAAVEAEAGLAEIEGALATRGLATAENEAVFWSGIEGGDTTAANWVAENGGATLETTMAENGVELPAWDANNPETVAAWRQASADFASGASGDVTVLQQDVVRVNSVWAEVEYPALQANPNITSITAVNPVTGVRTLLWAK
jgi:filamentous hemagglutinin